MVDYDALEQQYNEDEYNRYMSDIIQRKSEREGKSYRSVDPHQPVLSQRADDARQNNARIQSDVAQGSATKPPAIDFDAMEAAYEAAKPSTQAATPNAPTPAQSAVEKLITSIPGGSTAMDALMMPGDYLRGALKGRVGERVNPMEFAGADEAGPHGFEYMGRAIGGALVDPLLGLGFLGKLRGKPAPTIPADPYIGNARLPIEEADMSVMKERPNRSVNIAATGTPDAVAPGPSVRETGQSIVVPSLDAGEKTGLFNEVPGLDFGEYGHTIPPANLGEQTLLTAEPIKPKASWFDEASKRIKQDAAGEAILDDMIERGVSPQTVVADFWANSYGQLPREVQARFEKYITRETGFKPGSTVAVAKDGTVIKANTWEETYPVEQTAKDAEYLEGTERGLITLMAMANDGVKSGAFKSTTATPYKRFLQPGEQLSTGEEVLRPQVLRHPGYPQPEVIPNPENLKGKGFDPNAIEMPGVGPRDTNITPFTQKFLMDTAKVKQDILKRSYTPLDDYRLNLQTSSRGSVAVKEAEKDSGIRYSHIPGVPSDLPLVFPGWPSRITQSITDTLRQTGPAGANISKTIDDVLTNRAMLSSYDVVNTVPKLDTIAGKRGVPGRIIEGFRELTKGENAFVWGSHRHWNLTEAEIEQAFNYMDSKGVEIPKSTKARAWADALYEGMLRPVSQSAHEAGLDVLDPMTGKHKPYAAPHMHIPHVPVKSVSIQGISDTHLELAYKQKGGFEGTGKSFPMWKSQLAKILSQGPELRESIAAGSGMDKAAITYDMAVKKYKGLEVAQMLDLGSLGGSRYQWAKKLGYEHDPFRAVFRANSSGYLRTEWAKAMPSIEQDMVQIAEKGGTDLTQWATKAVDRAQGINTGLSDSRIIRNLVSGVRDFNNATMLQLGGLNSLPQLGYALGRAPYIKSMLGAVDFVTGNNKLLIDKSGGLYPTLMNQLMQPEGPLSTVSSAALRTQGVTLIDKWSRYFGAHVGNRYVDFLEASILKHPQKERLHKLIDEMGGHVGTILKEGKIPENMRLAMIQKYANYSAGIPDARGLPLIATSETAYARLGNQYRTFMFNNQAELVRLWRQAPTTADAINRITKVMLGTGTSAAVTGAVSEYIRNAFNDEEGSPFVNKKLHKLVGNEGAAFAIQTITYGLGALFGALALTALDNGWKLAAGLVLGPTGTLIEGVSEDTVDSIINGPNWKSMRTAARRTPLLGPVLAPLVRENIKEQTDDARREQQLQRALMPPSGFENEP